MGGMLRAGPSTDRSQSMSTTSRDTEAKSCLVKAHLQLRRDIDDAAPHANPRSGGEDSVPIETSSAALCSPERHPLAFVEQHLVARGRTNSMAPVDLFAAASSAQDTADRT